MTDVLLNGRVPLPWELPALERGRRCELERDAEVLAGVLTKDREPARPGAVRSLLLPPLGPL